MEDAVYDTGVQSTSTRRGGSAVIYRPTVDSRGMPVPRCCTHYTPITNAVELIASYGAQHTHMKTHRQVVWVRQAPVEQYNTRSTNLQPKTCVALVTLNRIFTHPRCSVPTISRTKRLPGVSDSTKRARNIYSGVYDVNKTYTGKS